MNTDTSKQITPPEDISLSSLDIEAKNRLAEILTGLETQLGTDQGPKLALYELQERSSGKTIPPDKAIFQMDYLKKLLYDPEMKKKELRRILAEIAYRAKKLLERSKPNSKGVIAKI